MKLNVSDNRRAVFFCLWLADFIVAAQAIAIPLFSQNIIGFDQGWIAKSFLLTAGAFFLLLVSFNIFFRRREIVGLIQPGLFFLASGALIDFLAEDFNLFIFGRIISGLGAAMVIVGQLGMVWYFSSKESKKVSFLIASAFFLGSFSGPILIDFLSGNNLGGIKTFFVLGMAIFMVAILEISKLSKKFAEWAAEAPAYSRGENKKREIFNIISKEGKNMKERAAIWGMGYLGNAVIVYGFDYFLYPSVIWKFGIIKGGIVMTFLSFLICYATIIFYDWAKKDWLGIETLKEVKEYHGKSFFGRLSSWILRKSDPAVLLFLSIKFDPFITTAYMRKGADLYNGLKKRDWNIFLSSLIIGNVYWTFVSFTGISVIRYVWNFISRHYII
jgi:MFS family permease